MVDPDPYDNGYLNYNAPDPNAVLAQVSCLWGSDPVSDMLLSASSWFQIYDELMREQLRQARCRCFTAVTKVFCRA